MAKLPALIQTCSTLAGMPGPQLKWIARQLREAGQISTFGRGRYGAEMTASDSANLIVGVLAHEAAAKSCADAVRRLHKPQTVSASQQEPGSARVPLDLAAVGYHYPSFQLTTLPDAVASLLTPTPVFGERLHTLEIGVRQTLDWDGRLRVTLSNQVTIQVVFAPQQPPPNRPGLVRKASLALSASELHDLRIMLMARPGDLAKANDNEPTFNDAACPVR